MDFSTAGLPIHFWYQEEWYSFSEAGVVNSNPVVKLDRPNEGLERKLKRIMLREGRLTGTYSIDIANTKQCFQEDYIAYQNWSAAQ